MDDFKPPRRNLRVFMYGGMTLVVLIFIAACLLVLFPEKWFWPWVGDRGSAALGREFAVDGPIDIDWDWGTPRIRAEKVRLANLANSKEANMLEIQSLEFSVRLRDLLIGRLTLPEVNIARPRIILEKRDAETKNWDLPIFSKGAVVANAVTPDSRHDFPLIGKLVVTDGILVYRDIPKKLDATLNLSTAVGTGGNGDDKIVLKGDGNLEGQKFELDAQGGSISTLRETDKAYPLIFKLSMGPTKVEMQGKFLDPVKLRGIDGILNLQGNNLADLFYLTGIPLPPTPPYSISGKVGKKGKVWSYQNMQGKVGDSDIAGNLNYDLSGKRGFAKADLSSNLLDIDDIGGLIGLAPGTGKGETAAPEQKKQAAQEAERPRILPDIPINLARLRAADMDVKLEAREIRAPGWPLQSIAARFNLQEGLLKLDPVTMGVSDGTAEGVLVFDGRKDIPDVTIDLDLKHLSLKGFFEGTHFEDLSAGVFGGHIKLTGQGKSLAEVLAVSNGRLTISMSGGKISLLIVEAAGIDIAEATPLLLGEDSTTNIRCAVGDFKVDKGLLKSDIFVFDTTDSNIEGNAKISLKDETIDARIETHPKDESPLSARTPILITGPLKSPSIGLDPAEAGLRGAGAAILGSVLTPLAAIIPFIELGLGEDSDCADLMAQARAHEAEPAGR